MHQYRTHRVISAYSVIVNLMNLSILEKRIIGVHILRGFPLMENWIEGCGRCRVTAVGNTWSERGTTRVLTIDTIKTESKILT